MPHGGTGRRYSTGGNPNHTAAYRTNDFVVSMSSDTNSNQAISGPNSMNFKSNDINPPKMDQNYKPVTFDFKPLTSEKVAYGDN